MDRHIDDIEQLGEQLGFERWIAFGSSSGENWAVQSPQWRVFGKPSGRVLLLRPSSTRVKT